MKWLKCLVALCTLLTSHIVVAGSAHATSGYDDNYHTTDQLILRYQDCPTVDISNTWDQYLGSQTSSYQNAATNSAMGVSERPHFDDANNGNLVAVYWSDHALMSANWTAYAPVVTTVADHIVHIRLTKTGSGCQIVQAYDFGIVEISHPTDLVLNYFFTGKPSYPGGYAGTPIETHSSDTTLYSNNTIDCGGLEVQGAWVNQEGNSGKISWNYESAGRATWSYRFNDNPYSISIGCGGEPSDWLTVNESHDPDEIVYPTMVSNDWVCDTFSYYCVLG